MKNRGILKSVLSVLLAVFVAFSFQLLNYLFQLILGIRSVTLANTSSRIILSGIWLVLAAGILFLRKQNPLDAFRILTVRKKAQAWLLPLNCVLGFVAGISLNRMVTLLVSLLPQDSKLVQQNAESVKAVSDGSPILVIFAVYLCAPLVEELIYRGKTFYYFEDAFGEEWGTVLAAVLSSVLFAVAHSGWLQMGYAFLCGLFFCLLGIRAGSILPGITAHVGFNFGNLLLYSILNSRESTAILANVVLGFLLVACTVFIVISGNLLRGSDTAEKPANPSIYLDN